MLHKQLTEQSKFWMTVTISLVCHLPGEKQLIRTLGKVKTLLAIALVWKWMKSSYNFWSGESFSVRFVQRNKKETLSFWLSVSSHSISPAKLCWAHLRQACIKGEWASRETHDRWFACFATMLFQYTANVYNFFKARAFENSTRIWILWSLNSQLIHNYLPCIVVLKQ